MPQFLGSIAAFVVLFILVGRAAYVSFDAFGHLLWIVPLCLVAGVVLFLRQADKGIYK